MLQTRDGCIRVYKRRNERLAGNCVLEVDNFGGGSVKMWGAISYARKTKLVHITDNLNAARYRDEVLTLHILPAMDIRRNVFQHGQRSAAHISCVTVDVLANQNVRVLPGRLNHHI
jgi:hypothetical protein